jgi:peptidyl-prolyl cis-trans isomerase SurA
MKVKIFLVVVISIVSIVLMSCSSSNISKEESLRVDTLALVSKDVISLKQYEDFYLKNNVGVNPKDISEESKKEFLDLIIKYRLKINDAYKKGYDKDPIVQQEIKDYEKSLAIPFALDREIVEPNIKTWYERRKENRKIYTIMLRADMNNPSDTLEKYNLINSLLDSLNRGANFKNIATRYTQIGTGQVADSGLLGYVSVGQTVRVFEDAIFSLKPGQYTKVPVRRETCYNVPML